MARRSDYSVRDSLYWDETECLDYYWMLSLHEVFHIVGAQLTETDIEVLSFLLDETFIGQHPLDPVGWTVEPNGAGPDNTGMSPSPALLNAWRRLRPQDPPCPVASRHKPKSGLELLLDLERRGYVSEGKLEPLLQLLRVLTRHDLLPFVTGKKRRTVSPTRIGQSYAMGSQELLCPPMPNSTNFWRAGNYPPVSGPASRRRSKRRGHGWSRRSKRTERVSCPPSYERKESCDIRLRVRAEYLENESVLRGGVSSNKPQPLERQFELFSRASSLLGSRDLGSVICDIKFTELNNLEAFWGDYLSGALLEALKAVFISDTLRLMAGTDDIRLLIAVDQDDYEEARRILSRRLRPANGATP
ncbi:death effector domain-containing 1 isoform X2 [Lampris incognitus]|uniref:death effector domain-containing 1 isoform X2 n=1 Tax=Lampris incognitus TaxID=2546036 RepID=UPI0024B606B0|nr:death effector domain-containing 1 isoform X2 [Lampris incognitus]